MLSGATSTQRMEPLSAETVVQAVTRLLHATEQDGALQR
jgi:hypothetical protein